MNDPFSALSEADIGGVGTKGGFVPHSSLCPPCFVAPSTNVRSGEAAPQRPSWAGWRLRAGHALRALAFGSTPPAMRSRKKTRRRNGLLKLSSALAIVAAILVIGDRSPHIRDALEDQLRDILQSEQARDRVGDLAHVIDGDTLDINGTRIRMFGIDAPEGRQTCRRNRSDWACGEASTDALVDAINQREVRCEERDTDRYGRVVAECWTGNRNLNAWMVAEGWAVAYRQYGGDIYDAEEHAAKDAKRGVWSSRFDMPWDWRRHARSTN